MSNPQITPDDKKSDRRGKGSTEKRKKSRRKDKTPYTGPERREHERRELEAGLKVSRQANLSPLTQIPRRSRPA